ncbi:MAG: GspH/FimT family pseudopilin [Brachymonas sp.]
MKHTSQSLPVTQNGFTLVELMVTVALFAILMVLAVPSFNGVMASNRLTSTTNELFTAMSIAKSEAVKLGTRVTVCASSDGVQCSNDQSAWHSGWITFVDSTRTGTVSASVDSGETVLAIGQPVPDGLLISGQLAFVSFSADGRSRDMSGGFAIARYRVCSTSSSLTDAERYRELSTAVAGRLAVKRSSELGAATVAASCPSL